MDGAIKARWAVARYLRALREQHGMTQRELAELVGHHPGEWSKVESATARFPSHCAETAAAVLSVEPMEFALHLFAFQEPALFRMVFPGCTIDPPRVSDSDLDRAKRVMARSALSKKRRRAQQRVKDAGLKPTPV